MEVKNHADCNEFETKLYLSKNYQKMTSYLVNRFYFVKSDLKGQIFYINLVQFSMFQTLPKPNKGERKLKDYIGLYLGLVVFTATGAKVRASCSYLIIDNLSYCTVLVILKLFVVQCSAVVMKMTSHETLLCSNFLHLVSCKNDD